MHSIKILTEAGYGKGFGHYFRMTSIKECADNKGIPFQMIIDGDDLCIVSRSGDENARTAHDGNIVTFHRVRDFRSLVY